MLSRGLSLSYFWGSWTTSQKLDSKKMSSTWSESISNLEEIEWLGVKSWGKRPQKQWSHATNTTWSYNAHLLTLWFRQELWRYSYHLTLLNISLLSIKWDDNHCSDWPTELLRGSNKKWMWTGRKCLNERNKREGNETREKWKKKKRRKNRKQSFCTWEGDESLNGE